MSDSRLSLPAPEIVKEARAVLRESAYEKHAACDPTVRDCSRWGLMRSRISSPLALRRFVSSLVIG